ncbi:uncharacterized protein LOC126264652 [Aethina tumida]|uniref:uncharacterized protein LOC126264652 n=1 Tax=Aethina tumida TaxID=116153 RepID=UPI0021481138|nr:uncharacterized protein LOC126264652 [Aethina tumida]
MVQLIKVVVVFAAQCSLVFGLWEHQHEQRIRLRLEDDERLILPKDFPLSSLKVVPDNKFYTDLLKPEKKTKYVKDPFGGKLKSGVDKKCCGNEWKGEVGIPLEKLFQPVLLAAPPPPLLYPHDTGLSGDDDHYGDDNHVKPVTEHIEDDLKYDFRTKTHSF